MKKLPVIGTTAASTVFCSTKVEGPDNTFLWLDGNSKVTWNNGDFQNPLPNAFSLEAQAVVDREALDGKRDDFMYAHCPGSTPTCRASCYVHGLEKHAAATYELYRHNSQMIRTILEDDVLANVWALVMAEWITTNCAGGFRWHVSGDVFSLAYAEWIADVVRESAPVKHWIYTRSFEFLGPLVGASTLCGGNLALNLSADKDNYAQAVDASATWAQDAGMPRICYLVTAADPIVPPDLARGSDVIFPDYDLRPRSSEDPKAHPFFQKLHPEQRKMLCPVDSYGKSEKNRCGPCDRCLK